MHASEIFARTPPRLRRCANFVAFVVAMIGLTTVNGLFCLVGCSAAPAAQETTVADEIAQYEAHLTQQPSDIAAYVQLAMRYVNFTGDRGKAAGLADRCVRANSGVPDAYLAAAYILIFTDGNRHTARAYLNRYLELNPRDERGYLLLADLDSQTPETAAATLDRGLNLFVGLLDAETEAESPPDPAQPADPSRSETPTAAQIAILRLAVAKAQLWIDKREYRPALDALRPFLRDPRLNQLPGIWPLEDLAARLEVAVGEDDAALLRLRRVLDDNPGEPEVIQSFVWLLLLQERPTDAIATLRDLLGRTESPPARQIVYLNLTQAEIMQNRLDMARSHVHRALEIDPESKAMLVALNQVLSLMVDTAGAEYRAARERMAKQRMAVFAMPQKIETLQAMFRGVFAQRFYRWEAAASAFTRAAELEPDLAWAAIARAHVAQEQELWREAIVWYRRALNERNLAPEIHCNIGDCYLKIGDTANAMRHYTDAMALIPNYPRARRGQEQAQGVRRAETLRAEAAERELFGNGENNGDDERSLEEEWRRLAPRQD